MLATIAGILLLLLTLGDAFEAMVLPRRVTRRWRLTRLFYRVPCPLRLFTNITAMPLTVPLCVELPAKLPVNCIWLNM
jgi:hypothetical protein